MRQIKTLEHFADSIESGNALGMQYVSAQVDYGYRRATDGNIKFQQLAAQLRDVDSGQISESPEIHRWRRRILKKTY